MEIKSVFNNMEKIPEKYTFYGKDINPPLEILDIPANAKTLALIFDDPDAPAGDWVHWILWNIPIVKRINENSVPLGAVQGLNDFKVLKYKGPSPPSGTHRYFLKVYALDSSLNLPEGSAKQSLEPVMKNHVLAKAELVGLFSKK